MQSNHMFFAKQNQEDDRSSDGNASLSENSRSMDTLLSLPEEFVGEFSKLVRLPLPDEIKNYNRIEGGLGINDLLSATNPLYEELEKQYKFAVGFRVVEGVDCFYKYSKDRPFDKDFFDKFKAYAQQLQVFDGYYFLTRATNKPEPYIKNYYVHFISSHEPKVLTMSLTASGGLHIIYDHSFVFKNIKDLFLFLHRECNLIPFTTDCFLEAKNAGLGMDIPLHRMKPQVLPLRDVPMGSPQSCFNRTIDVTPRIHHSLDSLTLEIENSDCCISYLNRNLLADMNQMGCFSNKFIISRYVKPVVRSGFEYDFIVLCANNEIATFKLKTIKRNKEYLIHFLGLNGELLGGFDCMADFIAFQGKFNFVPFSETIDYPKYAMLKAQSLENKTQENETQLDNNGNFNRPFP